MNKTTNEKTETNATALSVAAASAERVGGGKRECDPRTTVVVAAADGAAPARRRPDRSCSRWPRGSLRTTESRRRKLGHSQLLTDC